MAFLHLFVVNKSGGLIYHRPLSVKAPKININEWLRIGSTFHSLHAIASEASPTKLPNGKNSSTCYVRECVYDFSVLALSLSGLSSLSGLEPLLPINQLYHNSLSTLLVWFGLVGCLFVCLFVWWICGFVDLWICALFVHVLYYVVHFFQAAPTMGLKKLWPEISFSSVCKHGPGSNLL